MSQPEAIRDDDGGFLSLDNEPDDVGVRGQEEDNVVCFVFDKEFGVDFLGAERRGWEDEGGGVLALDGGKSDVSVLKIGSCR